MIVVYRAHPPGFFRSEPGGNRQAKSRQGVENRGDEGLGQVPLFDGMVDLKPVKRSRVFLGSPVLREFHFATTIIFDCSDERARSYLVVDRAIAESDLFEGILSSFVDDRLIGNYCQTLVSKFYIRYFFINISVNAEVCKSMSVSEGTKQRLK